MTRRLLTAAALTLLGCGVVAIAVHYLDVVSDVVARLAAIVPLLLVAAVLGLIAAAVTRRIPLIVVGVLIVAVGVATQLPLFVGHASGDDGDLTVMQANIYLGDADIPALARTVADRRVDVLSVSELTDSALAGIEASSIATQLPYALTQPAAEGGSGTGLFSRFPLADGDRLPGFRLANLRAEAEVPGHGRVALYAVHPLPPWPQPAWHWDSELERLGARMHDDPLPVIAAGDFNSTWDHAPLRAMLHDAGLTDAAEHIGAGMVPTYPANRPFPALLAIDRILTGGGAEPVSFERVKLPGSDHHGVVACVRI